MKNLPLTRQAAFVLFFCTLLAGPAAAVGITNLDSISYEIEVTLGGESQTVVIEPGATWWGEGHPIDVQVGKKRVRLEDGMDYAIWKGGVLTKQRRARSGKMRN